jgi:hypothetical protein
MFDMEHAIAEWRRQMRSVGLRNPAALDELESHLREEMEQLMELGLTAPASFEMAVQRLGQPGPLQSEWAKAGHGRWAPLRKLTGILREIFVPFPSVEFSGGGQETLDLARLEAPRLHHNFIGTEHVLLALLKLESGVVPNVLKKLAVNREQLKEQVEKWIAIFPSRKTGEKLPYTPRVKKALRLAAQEAETCGRACVGPEHIFLGLLLEGDGVAARVLRNLGVDQEAARREILRQSA